jgi:hypothetical protein
MNKGIRESSIMQVLQQQQQKNQENNTNQHNFDILNEKQPNDLNKILEFKVNQEKVNQTLDYGLCLICRVRIF